MSTIVNDLIEATSTYCLNQVPTKPWTNLTCGDHTLALESDADEQLLLHIGFRQTLKLEKITLGLPKNDTCPSEVSIFVNLNSPGFSDCEGKAAFKGTIDEDAGEVTFSLPAVKFNRVESITLFVSENHGGDISSMHRIALHGRTVMNTDVSKIHESK